MIAFALALGVLILLVRHGAHAFILWRLRVPRVAHHGTPVDLGLQAQTVGIPVAAGKTLFAWYVPVPGAAKSPAVLLMHGWGASASYMLPALAPLHGAGFAVLLLDARCHGESDEEAFTSLPRFAQDIEAGLDWLHLQPEVDANRLALMGHSVGAGASLLCATRRNDLRAVISLSAFAHPKEVMLRFLAHAHVPYPVLGWYVLRHVQRVIGARFDDIAPIRSISRARCPVLLVHGRQDEVVPFGDMRRLHSAGAAHAVQCVAVDAGHDLGARSAQYQDSLIAFLRQSFEP